MASKELKRGPGIHRMGALHHRARAAKAMLTCCTLCEWRCGVDRTKNEPCPCRLGAETYVYKRYVSVHEDVSLTPALRVFLAGCNFRCRFCDEGPDCFQPEYGARVDPDRFAADLHAALADGIRTISLIGGEPTLHAHTILAVAAAARQPLPLVLNSNMYMTTDVLDLLGDVVKLYLADFKFGNDACATDLAGVPRYMEVVCRNLRHAMRLTNVVVRHLLIPGHFDCCLRPVVDWMAENSPETPFQLYTGYVPCWRAAGDRSIGRLNTRVEARQAIDYMNAKLEHATVMDGHRPIRSEANLRSLGDGSITIGGDGRIYCHDLTPELAATLTELCPDGGGARTGVHNTIAQMGSET